MVHREFFGVVLDGTENAEEIRRESMIDAYLREYDGARERDLKEKMELIADTLWEEYEVDVDDIEGTRKPRVEVERAVPEAPVERAVAPAAKKATAAKRTGGTAKAIRGKS